MNVCTVGSSTSNAWEREGAGICSSSTLNNGNLIWSHAANSVCLPSALIKIDKVIQSRRTNITGIGDVLTDD